ncbi:MAG: PRC-barrel domain-containing protein [Deltaproteobacteria bacterium]|nr:PRC-barrel domain-containing protein [Deltaproteobacteria bacterium]
MRHSRKTLSASTIMDFNVENPAGDNLGSIEDIMIDVDGCVAYAVLSSGGVLGMGGKLFAVPWDRLSPSDKDKTFILNVPKESLQDVRSFDRDNWPDFSDPGWRQEVYDYYDALIGDQ